MSTLNSLDIITVCRKMEAPVRSFIRVEISGRVLAYDASEKFVSWAIFTTLTVLIEAIMPDDVALEKVKALEALAADVERVRPASIEGKK
jgi:hypothetical protein